MAVLQRKYPLPSSSAVFTHRKFSRLEIRNCLFTIPPISETNQRKSQKTLAYEQSSNGCGNSSLLPTSFSELIESLIDGVDLSESEAESSLDFLLNDANEALISAFLVLLRAKGETYEEVVGLASAMPTIISVPPETDPDHHPA